VIDRTLPVPPSQQLAAILRGQIESGELAPRARLPSILELAGRYELAGVTVRKALDILKDEGLIVAVSGMGTFVVESKSGGSD
jgi:DNA-binding GntR family transcriptional regulator